MAIIVKRFKVRRNGKIYGPGQPDGQVIEGLSKEEEARLIKNSNGTIEEYVPPKVDNAGGSAGQNNPEDGEGEQNSPGTSEEGKQNNSEAGGQGEQNNPEAGEEGEQDNSETGEEGEQSTEDMMNVNPEELIKTGDDSEKEAGKKDKKKGKK